MLTAAECSTVSLNAVLSCYRIGKSISQNLVDRKFSLIPADPLHRLNIAALLKTRCRIELFKLRLFECCHSHGRRAHRDDDGHSNERLKASDE
ncbi:hypothetical protein D9M68_946510 [compost metagenome]